MHRLIGIGVVSFGAGAVAAALAGASFWDMLWIIPLTVSLSIVGWAAAMIGADATFRPRLDASAMMQGVCPECRTFNSLQEVTSADPRYRFVNCQACKERYRVSMRHNGLGAERLGKFED